MMMRFRSQLLKYFAALPEGRSELITLSSLEELRHFIQRHFEIDISQQHTLELTRTLTKAKRKAKRRRLEGLKAA